MLFIILWVTFIYFPIAHMVWYWGGPDAFGDAAKAVAAATEAAAKTAAQAKLDEVSADAGLIYKWGALDFAGGTVVHINAGVAGIVGALVLGKRIGFGKELMAPHSLTMTMIGAALLWVGWFGFNAGSNLEANGTAGLAMMNTFVATAAAGLSWLFVEWAMQGQAVPARTCVRRRRGSRRCDSRGGLCGADGFHRARPVAGAVCFFFCSTVKNSFGYDDSLDVFGVHCIGGIIGAIGTGILVNPVARRRRHPRLHVEAWRARHRGLLRSGPRFGRRSRRFC